MSIRDLVLSMLGLLLISIRVHATVYAVGCNGLYSLYDAIDEAVADPNGPHLIKLGARNYIIGEYKIQDALADITIEGGYEHCSDAQPAVGQRATLTSSDSHARLLTLSNGLGNVRRSVTLRHMRLTAGHSNNGGGAIQALGNLELNLDDVRIDHNQSRNSGGGIYLLNFSSDNAKQTVLKLDGGSQINHNQSRLDGGGIYALGDVRIVFVDGLVNDNSAVTNGGGIAIETALSSLHLRPSASGLIQVSGNTAGGATFASNKGFGGAIYSKNADIDTAFNGTDNAYRLVMLNNTANYGGAIYVQGDPDPGADTLFTFVKLRNALVSGNQAHGKGGAFYSSDAVDWNLDHQAKGTCWFILFSSVCSVVGGNQANNQGTPGTPGGGAFYLTSEAGSHRGIARIRRTLFSGNKDLNGTVAVGMADNANEFLIERSIFINNQAAGNSVLLKSAGPTRVRYSDMLANSVTRLFDFDGSILDVQGSIFADPDTPIWFHSPDAVMRYNDCLLSNTPFDIPLGAQIGTARLDADFTPHDNYPLLDDCGNGGSTAISDIYGHSVRDIPGIDNYSVGGINDLGAVEQTDIIFHGGFGRRPSD